MYLAKQWCYMKVFIPQMLFFNITGFILYFDVNYYLPFICILCKCLLTDDLFIIFLTPNDKMGDSIKCLFFIHFFPANSYRE